MVAAMETSIRGLQKELDDIRSGSSIKSNLGEEGEKMLLSKSSGQLFAGYLDVPELAVEIERAVWQVEKGLKAQQERKEEKAELDATAKKSEPGR